MGTFFGAKVTNKEITPYVPRPLAPGEPSESLHLCGACIPATCKMPTGARVSLMLKQPDDAEALCLCTLSCGHQDSMLISVSLDAYAEFSLAGHKQAEVHIHGSFVPTDMPGSDDEGEDEDEENMNPVQMMQKQLQQLVGKSSGLGEIDDDAEDDDDSESDDEDASDDEGGQGADDDDERITTRYGGKKRVSIVELDENGKAVPEGLAGAADAITGAAADVAAVGADDDDDSDDDSDDASDEEGLEDGADDGVDAVAAQRDAQRVIDTADAALEKAGENGAAAAVPDEADSDDEDDSESSDEDDDAPAEERITVAADGATGAQATALDAGDSEEDDESSEEEEAEEAAKEERPVNGKRKAPGTPEEAPTKKMKKTAFANGFEVTELQAGSNPRAPRASVGQRVAVKFTGRLQSNKKVFDSTKGNKTFSFRLGVGEVIKGWDKGIAGMRVGDKRQLVVPPSMAYGETGVRKVIPKNATLVFDVELCQVHNSS